MEIFPGGHEIPLPRLVEEIWHIALILVSATLVGKILFGLLINDSFIQKLPMERRIAWAGVLVWMIQTLIIQIQRVNVGITWEGVFLDSIAVTIFWIALRDIREPRATAKLPAAR